MMMEAVESISHKPPRRAYALQENKNKIWLHEECNAVYVWFSGSDFFNHSPGIS